MKKYYSLVESGNSADLYIFGDIVDSFSTAIDEAWEIDSGDTSGYSLVKDLNALSKDINQINVHINSFGGYTNEGIAIYNTLKNSNAKVVTYCDGFACSAASIVFMAGDERIMGNGSMLMIHNAWNCVSGNAQELRQQADELEKISKSASECYLDKISISNDELQTLLDGTNHNGTWLSASEAIDMGFATKVEDLDDTSSVANQSAKNQLVQMVKSSKHQSFDAKKIYDELEKILSKIDDDKSDDTDDKKDDTDDSSDDDKDKKDTSDDDDKKDDKQDSQSKKKGWFF